MHITLDMSPVVHRKAGIATYTHNIAENLFKIDHKNTYSVFHYDHLIKEPLSAQMSQLPKQTVAWSARQWRLIVALRYGLNMTMDKIVMPQPTPPSAIFHATEHLLPPLKGAKCVFTFHDAIYALFPQFHLRANLFYLNAMMPLFLRRAHKIIAVSECSKRDCVRLYGIDPHKITVIYEGVDARYRPVTDIDEYERVRDKYRLPRNFILYLATIEPRKNLLALIESYHQVINHGSQSQAAVDLVIAGKKGWLFEPVFEKVRALGLQERVHFTDWVAQDDAPVMMNMAQVFIYPSLYEGFGLPPLEAMACGTPVICSNTSSLPEVVGDAGLLIDPHNVETMTQALERLLNDQALRQDLSARGLKQAAKFNWEQAARQTLAVYDDLQNRP
jgi:glycosyltransferase involved in cell wall biosynthesis